MALQKLSDLICLENGLSVIEPRKPSERAKRSPFPPKETFRSVICADIDAALLHKPKDFDKFYKLLMEQGYEIKRGKNPAARGKGQKRFIRLKSLGEGYAPEDLEKIISGEIEQSPNRKENAKRSLHTKRDFDLLIDIQEKIKQGKGGGYERWAKVYNIKQISQALLFLQEHDVRDYETLSERASAASSGYSNLTTTIKNAENRLNEITDLKKHIFNYSKTKEVYEKYRKSGYSKKFYEEHREEITIQKAAKKAFSELGGKPPKIKELNAEYAQVLAEKKKAYSEYHQAKKDRQDYVTAKHNIDMILGDTQREEQERKKKKEKESTR